MDRSRLIAPISNSRGYRAVADELPRLTDRDRTILGLLAEHQTFTTDQLAAIAFGSLGRARNRLTQLHQRGVLDRFRHYQRPGSQSWRWVLGPVGAAIIAAERGEQLPRPAAVRDRMTRLATSPVLGHLLGCNGFGAALFGYARTHPGYALARWWAEPTATRAAAGLARPDGHGVWVAPDGRRAGWWLEHDTGTEPLARVIAKLTDYAALAGTAWALPVLFWVPTARRAANLTDRVTDTPPPPGVAVAVASADTPSGPAGPVWRLAGCPGRHALADLPIPSDTSTVDGEPWDA